MSAGRLPSLMLAAILAALCGLLAACGSSAPGDLTTPTASAASIPAPALRTKLRLLDWPEFGLDPQRSDVSEAATGITAANVGRLRRITVQLPGTVDSSPIYLHGVTLADGREASTGTWPVAITRDATREKLAAALNIAGSAVIATTGGYIGDGPTYQGHVVLIDRASGRIRRIFNTLCANRRELLVPSTCSASDSAILSRGGAVVEPSGRQILLDTGNAPWNGTSNFGDSVLELTLPDLSVRQSFTPLDQAQLNSSDSDLGSSAPVLLGGDRVLVAGKDGVMRVLVLSRLDGHPPSGAPARLHPLGGEVQRLSVPGGGELFTSPAVWHHAAHTTVFLADANGTAAYVLRAGRLYRAWENSTPGASPVMAGGLLYVYDPSAGGIEVYRPGSPHPIAKLAGASGHWNSPIVADGHVVEPEGNGNDHRSSDTIEIFSAR